MTGGNLGNNYGHSSKHEGQRVFEVSLECCQPSSPDSTVNSSMVRAQSDFHRLNYFESTFFLSRWNEFRFRCTDSQNTRLRRVDDSSKVVNAKHSQVGDSESSALDARRLA